jgi:DNA-binding transcriptional LysR family regulator
MDPQPTHLRSFVAVAEELHFGRAAQRLGIAQPAVSRHVRALEETLGAPLLIRTSRATSLTAAGDAALASARVILAELDRLARTVADAAAGRSGCVTVGFVASTVSTWLPALLAAVRARQGALDVDAVQIAPGTVGDELRRGTIDLAVTRWHDDDDLVSELLGVEPTVAVLPPGHPFAERDAIAVAELREDTLVMTTRRAWPAAHEAQLQALRARGLPCDNVRDAAAPAAAMALVAAGAGVFLRARSGVEPGTTLACVPLSDQQSQLLALRRAGPDDQRLLAVVAELRALVAASAQD